MSSNTRAKRVGEVVRAEIAQMLTKGLKDPRIGFVSVMEVRMSKDLRYANVYVSLYGDEKERKSSMIGLENSKGYIRKTLGKKMRLYVTPEIRFFEDTTLDNVFHLEEVFEKLHADDAERAQQYGAPEDPAEEIETADDEE